MSENPTPSVREALDLEAISQKVDRANRAKMIAVLADAMLKDRQYRFWDPNNDDYYSKEEYRAMAEYLVEALEYCGLVGGQELRCYFSIR